MRDAAHHELRMEPMAGLQLAVSLITAVLDILTHMQEADSPPTRGTSHQNNGSHHNNSHHNNKAPRRPASEGGSVPRVVPGPLVDLRIDGEREYAVDEVGVLLSISPQTVRKMIDNKKLKAERHGKGRGHWIIQGAELLRFTHQTDDQPS